MEVPRRSKEGAKSVARWLEEAWEEVLLSWEGRGGRGRRAARLRIDSRGACRDSDSGPRAAKFLLLEAQCQGHTWANRVLSLSRWQGGAKDAGRRRSAGDCLASGE